VCPFPSDLPAPPSAPYNFSSAPFCQKCNAKATNRFCHCPDNKGWLCSICNFKNFYSDDRPIFQDALQVQVPVLESFSFHGASPVDSSQVVPIQHHSLYHLLVFELSDFAQPTFALAVDRLIDALGPGYFSVFAFNSGLIISVIASDRRRFPSRLLSTWPTHRSCRQPGCFFSMSRRIAISSSAPSIFEGIEARNGNFFNTVAHEGTEFPPRRGPHSRVARRLQNHD
jgi:hypothetical protein